MYPSATHCAQRPPRWRRCAAHAVAALLPGHMGSLLQTTTINRCAGCLASFLLVRTDLGTSCCSGTADAAPAAAGSLIGTRERNKVIRHA